MSQIFIREEANPEPKRITPRWGQIFVWGGVFFLLAIVGLALYNNQRGRVAIGEPAPDFTLNTFDGQVYKLSELKGKVVLVNIWASWCVPCENEAPLLEAAWKHFQPRGDVLFLGVDYTDTERAAKAYLERFGITYPNGPDLGTRIYSAYRATGVPETFIINQDGILAGFKYGEFTSVEEIIDKVALLLR
jgi:cytochrome c biogenesis protein CcmG/thiol:disulfide interchange protein DsbE